MLTVGECGGEKISVAAFAQVEPLTELGDGERIIPHGDVGLLELLQRFYTFFIIYIYARDAEATAGEVVDETGRD